MADRRSLGLGLEAFGQSLYEMLARKQALDKAAQAQQATADREATNQDQSFRNQLIMESLKNPEVGARASDQGLTPELDRPSDTTLNAGTLKLINDAKTQQDMPTLQAILGSLRSAGVNPLTKIGDTAVPGIGVIPGGPDQQGLSQVAQQDLGALNDKNRQFDQLDTVPVKSYDDTTNRMTTQYLPKSKLAGQTFPEEATPEQKGLNEGTTELSKITTPGLTQAQVAKLNEIEAGTRKGKAATAGAEESARKAAAFPYQTPVIGQDASGKTTALRFGPNGAQSIPLPEGFVKGSQQKLTATQVDNVTGLNTAETEGVKVLAMLKKEGLDRINDPLDPRFQKFMATKLKMESGDFNKGDIQQRTAFMNAVMTRGLMGARPSQYIAELIQQHLPQGDMTGEKLYHVIENVLEQAGERRDEIAALTNRPAGSLDPVSGTTFKSYRHVVGEDLLDSARTKLMRR